MRFTLRRPLAESCVPPTMIEGDGAVDRTAGNACRSSLLRTGFWSMDVRTARLKKDAVGIEPWFEVPDTLIDEDGSHRPSGVQPTGGTCQRSTDVMAGNSGPRRT